MPCLAPARGKNDLWLPWDPDIDNDPCGKPIVASIGGINVEAENRCLFHQTLRRGHAGMASPIVQIGTFGYSGGLPNVLDVPNHYKQTSRFQAPERGAVTKLALWFSGLGSGSGSQVIKAVIYSDNGGVPLTLLGTSAEVTIPDGSAARSYDFAFAPSVPVQAGFYHLGFISGDVNSAAQAGYDAGNPIGRTYNVDPYADGATNPYGTPGGSDGWTIGAVATYVL